MQHVEGFRCDVLPAPMHHTDDVDRLGNHRSCFTVNQPHRELEVSARSRVRVQAVEPPDPAASAPWESVRERLRYAAGRAYEPASEFVHHSPFVPALPGLRHWAASALRPGRPVAELGLELMARVHAEFTYRSASTEVDTPLADVLARREGVCQDFAHLLIGALRSMGLAARYVSGYLLTDPPPGLPRLVGADASHAWVSVFCPLNGWVDLDPTNDMRVADRHVTVAWGRDYSDVTPLRGVLLGGDEHQLYVGVSVIPMDTPGAGA
jgi:transglutaminase-like putative cysteine protease